MRNRRKKRIYGAQAPIPATESIKQTQDKELLPIYVAVGGFICVAVVVLIAIYLVVSVVSSVSAANVKATSADTVVAAPELAIKDLVFLDDRAVVSFGIRNSPVQAASVDVSLFDKDGNPLVLDSTVSYKLAYNIAVDDYGNADTIVEVPFSKDVIDACESVDVHARDWSYGVSYIDRTDLVASAKQAYLGTT